MCVSWYNAFHPLVCEERLNELDPGLLEIKRYHFPHTPWDSFMACLNEKAIDTRLKSYGATDDRNPRHPRTDLSRSLSESVKVHLCVVSPDIARCAFENEL